MKGLFYNKRALPAKTSRLAASTSLVPLQMSESETLTASLGQNPYSPHTPPSLNAFF